MRTIQINKRVPTQYGIVCRGKYLCVFCFLKYKNRVRLPKNTFIMQAEYFYGVWNRQPTQPKCLPLCERARARAKAKQQQGHCWDSIVCTQETSVCHGQPCFLFTFAIGSPEMLGGQNFDWTQHNNCTKYRPATKLDNAAISLNCIYT